MKRVETHKGSGEFVNALEASDLSRLRDEFSRIEDAWYREWQSRGCRDEGSCCLGVGVSVYHIPKRARQPKKLQVIRWSFSQGDLEADRTKGIPLRMLAALGVDGVYDCGRMD